MRGRALCQQKQGEGYRARLHHQRWRCSGAPPDLLPTTIWPPGACAFGFASAHFLFDQCNRCSSLSCSASAAAARLLLPKAPQEPAPSLPTPAPGLLRAEGATWRDGAALCIPLAAACRTRGTCLVLHLWSASSHEPPPVTAGAGWAAADAAGRRPAAAPGPGRAAGWLGRAGSCGYKCMEGGWGQHALCKPGSRRGTCPRNSRTHTVSSINRYSLPPRVNPMCDSSLPF